MNKIKKKIEIWKKWIYKRSTCVLYLEKNILYLIIIVIMSIILLMIVYQYDYNIYNDKNLILNFVESDVKLAEDGMLILNKIPIENYEYNVIKIEDLEYEYQYFYQYEPQYLYKYEYKYKYKYNNEYSYVDKWGFIREKLLAKQNVTITEDLNNIIQVNTDSLTDFENRLETLSDESIVFEENLKAIEESLEDIQLDVNNIWVIFQEMQDMMDDINIEEINDIMDGINANVLEIMDEPNEDAG